MYSAPHFVKYLFVPLIVVLTVLGSTAGLLVLSRNRLRQIGPRHIYRCLFSFEYLNLMFIAEYMRFAFELDIKLLSTFICKAYMYTWVFYNSVPPMLYVYISLERFVSITYPARRFWLRKKRVQWLYFMSVVAYNALCYSFLLFHYDIVTIAMSLTRTECSFRDANALVVFNYLDLISRFVVPFVLMLVCTGLLIYQIFRSRRRCSCSLNNSNKTFHKDVRFSVTAVLLNCVYCCLSLPFSVYTLMPDYLEDKNVFYGLAFLLALCYSLDAYLVFMTNSLFRAEFYRIFKSLIRPSKYSI